MRGTYPPVITPSSRSPVLNLICFKEPEPEPEPFFKKLKELVCSMMDLTQRVLIIITSQNLSLEKL
jgi:hypothetical protein